MTLHSQGAEPDFRLLRRQLLVAVGLTMAAASLVACSPAPQPPPPPDPLEPLAKRAGADAKLAGMISATFASLAQSMELVTTIRNEHAAALERELDRARPGRARTSASTSPATSSGVPQAVSAPPDLATALTSMTNALVAAEQEAADAVLTLPMYRAGLVGSIAAACACVREVLIPGAASTSPTASNPAGTAPARQTLSTETVTALQRALAAEHAAVWTCELASAFFSQSLEPMLNTAGVAHRARLAATERLLRDTGAHPVPAEPAYVTPQPVTDQASAVALLVTAENDAAAAWRAVLEHTDAVEVRRSAQEALTGSAVRATRWYKTTGQPLPTAAKAFPGQP